MITGQVGLQRAVITGRSRNTRHNMTSPVIELIPESLAVITLASPVTKFSAKTPRLTVAPAPPARRPADPEH